MINKHIQESLEILEKDASFIKGIKEIIQKSEESGLTREEGMKSIKSAYALILHILDFYVTVDMIDMDADLLRLCDEDPQMAQRFHESLNDAALALKKNYQYLCKKGTIYELGLPLFRDMYAVTLMAYLDKESPGKIARPNFFLPFSEMEFIKIGNDRDTLENKLKHVSHVEFSINSIQRFIDKCFSWSDKISEYQTRQRVNKSIYELNLQTLNCIHAVCNDVAYYKTTADKFAEAMMNSEKSTLKIKNKNLFYAVLYALYLKMENLSIQEPWLNTVLKSFELERNNYASAVNRIKNENDTKLKAFFNKINSILDMSRIC